MFQPTLTTNESNFAFSQACPEEVTRLEGMWGNWLVSSRQAGAAVPHLIEAGETRAALAAAIKAHHYKRALQIVQVCK